MDGVRFIDDDFRTARESWSSLLLLTCSACHAELGLYQKDGPGPLLRCYANRFVQLTELTVASKGMAASPSWSCDNCNALLGSGFAYKDGRWAYALSEHAIQWQILATEATEATDAD